MEDDLSASLIDAVLEGSGRDVRYFDEEWILGRSVLEGLDAPHGPGVDFDATIPVPT